ncbi:MAG: pseudouridine synthase [Bacteroidota bacterium]
MKVRLNKFLSECGIASRRKSEEFIIEGRISVNGKRITDLAYTIEEENDIVTLDGEKIKPQKKVYFLLNKPKGYITTTDDERGRKKVTDLIDSRQKVFPVGRLDYDTTGVLLLTNDGDFSNFLTHPKNHVPREYEVTLNEKLKIEDKEKLLKGIILDGRKSKLEEIQPMFKGSYDKLKVKTVEGRNHFVKRMFGILGYHVEKLNRSSFGIFKVKGIPVGSYKKLSYNEVQECYKTYAR